MKRLLFTILMAALSLLQMQASDNVLRIVHGNMTDYAPLSDIDSIYFDETGATMYIQPIGEAVPVGIVRTDISSMEFISASDCPDRISVVYNGSTVTTENPFLLSGVSIAVDGSYVTVRNTNTATEYTTELSGTATDGAFTYEGEYKTTIILNGVTITNPKGPAIDIQCGKRIALELKKNTVNTLADGTGGDWKAALYCKGHLEIDKAGVLNVTGNTKHAISAKEYLQLKKAEGTINILGAKGDGMHCGQYFLANGCNVNISGVAGDGIQAEQSGEEGYAEEYADGSLWIQGGTFTINCSGSDVAGLKADTDININAEKSVPVINITMTGTGSKGMKANNINIVAGEITINDSGAPLVEGTDVQTAKCISADASINILAGTLNLLATGTGGKCIKSDGTISIGDKSTGEGPSLSAKTTGEKYTTGGGSTPGGGGTRPGRPGGGGGFPGGESSEGSSAKAIKAMGAIDIYGGELSINTATEGAEGLESKTGINIAGGKHYLKCYDDCINCSGSIAFNGGITVCFSNGNDAVDSNYGRTGSIVIGNGTVLTYSSRGGAEMGFDCDGNSYIQITGKGIAISAGGNQGGSTSATLSNAAQGYAFVTSSISYQTGRYYTIADSKGNNLVTYSFEGNVSSTCSMFTATGMTKGASYTVKYSTKEPTDAVTSFHGLYLGSSATGTTSVTSFTAK